MVNRNTRRILIALALILAMVGVRYIGIGNYINVNFFAQNKAHVCNFMHSWPIVSRVCYMLIYMLVVACAIPVSIPLTVLGGYFFGAGQAAILAITSATVGSTITFLLFRHLLYESMQQKYGMQLSSLTNNIRKYGANYILFLQLLPITPFGFIVIAASLAGLPLRTFVWSTAGGIIPSTCIYAYAGQELGSLDSFGSIFAPRFVVPLVLLSLLALAPIVLRHFKIIK